MLRVVIDGEAGDYAQGTLLLHAMQAAGCEVPHLCHDDRLKPSGGLSRIPFGARVRRSRQVRFHEPTGCA